MHRAPKGALRPREAQVLTGRPAAGQKAPSAKRCIKTVVTNMSDRVRCNDVREHRAPKGALRRAVSHDHQEALLGESESTERQKVH